MALCGDFGWFGVLDNLIDDRLQEEISEEEWEDFCESSFDEMFKNWETALLLEVRGFPFFCYLERKLVSEC